MRVLLDTNILIHREAVTVVRDDIGKLFYWLDKLKCEKCIHPASIEEIKKHRDPRVRKTFQAKLEAYRVLKTKAPVSPKVQEVAKKDQTDNDRNDTLLVNELFSDRVDALISEDRGLHAKALQLSISDRVFTIDSFLEKVLAENPELVDYSVLAVKKDLVGTVDLASEFFDMFRKIMEVKALTSGSIRRPTNPHTFVMKRKRLLLSFTSKPKVMMNPTLTSSRFLLQNAGSRSEPSRSN